MNRIITAIFLLGLFSASVATAQPRAPRVVSPEVHADRSITFRVNGPELTRAILQAPWAGEPALMKRGDDGIWSVTLGPVDPQIYSYNYEIDGVSVIDPHNPRVKLWDGGAASLVEVPGSEPTAYDWIARPHGDLHIHHFRSSATDRERRVFVYTPPDYEAGKGRYPTLYLLHGSGDNESTWTELGKANLILDNLIAEGKAERMIVVMTNGHPVSFGARRSGSVGGNTELYIEELTKDVIPLVEHRYRVNRKREARAIAGLSMGGGQSLNAGLGRLDLFAWVAAFSASTRGVQENPAISALAEDAKKANKEIKLLWIAIGKDDFLLEGNQSFHKFLKQKGIDHSYKISAGGHSWPVWRGYLEELVRLLFQ